MTPNFYCPNCREWYQVEPLPHETWLVTPCDYEPIEPKSWAEASSDPVCPTDAATLKPWLIEDEIEIKRSSET